ncbi:MAG: phosphatidylglycerophosphatase A [Calditrichaeota bacterium]|nr:MAG: phosphatidylglycerophosphatase A [Calditrichota bacterium]
MNPIVVFIATGAGSGYFPKAPGTAGSALAVVCLLFLSDFSSPVFLLVTGVIVFIGIWSASRAEVIFKKEDPAEVVIDEVAGILISVSFLPPTGFTLLAAFVLFRLFDIFKPWPVRQSEEAGVWLAKKFPDSKWIAENKGGIGIMLDDILAGLYANLTLQIMTRYIF